MLYKTKSDGLSQITVHEVISSQLLLGPVAKSMVISTKEVVLTKGTKRTIKETSANHAQSNWFNSTKEVSKPVQVSIMVES